GRDGDHRDHDGGGGEQAQRLARRHERQSWHNPGREICDVPCDGRYRYPWSISYAQEVSTQSLVVRAERDKSMPGAYRAVVFDFFGTLTHAVRRGPAHRHI